MKIVKNPSISRSKAKEIDKRAARHAAFNMRFSPAAYIPVRMVRYLIRGMIADHETHEAFNMHHKINAKVQTMATPVLEVVTLINTRGGF